MGSTNGTLVNEETADEQRFFLVDITQAELAEAFKQDGQRVKQTLIQHLQACDGEQQDVLLIGDCCFSNSDQDRQLLADCNDLASHCSGYFLAAADQTLLDVVAGESGARYLQNIATDRVMLAYPRFLSRLPYGKKWDPIETFAFEECGEIPRFHELLWGCPAFMIARSLVRNSQVGTSPDALFFSDIPVFSFERDGEKILQPGTEIVLTESQANGIFAAGIMPLIGYRQMRGIRLIGFTNLT
jgi:predicted component of type VI protein secretion system